MICLDVNDTGIYKDFVFNDSFIEIEGVKTKLKKTIVKDIFIGHNSYYDFLYSIKTNERISRKHDEIGDFFIFEDNGQKGIYAKVKDYVFTNDKDGLVAELSFFIDAKGIISTPISLMCNGYKNLELTYDSDFNYDEYKQNVVAFLLEKELEIKKTEAMQLKLRYKKGRYN